MEAVSGTQVRIKGRDFVSFASNDYLGLSQHPEVIEEAALALRAWGVGAKSARLLQGYTVLHEALEKALAEFLHLPSALLFPSGYQANLAVLSTLAGRNGEIFSDRLNHASMNDGARLSFARFSRYPHLDLETLEKLLQKSRAKEKIIATESVFSMDGDTPPLPEMLALAHAHGAWLYIDDAHGLGVLAEGRGTLAHFGLKGENVILMATLGKALGAGGAFVAGPKPAIRRLEQEAKSQRFTTALAPALAAAALKSLAFIQEKKAPLDVLKGHIAKMRAFLGIPWIGAIWPFMVGDEEETRSLSSWLLGKGFYVPAVFYPTVPQKKARLRISLSGAHEEEHLLDLLGLLDEAKKMISHGTPLR